MRRLVTLTIGCLCLALLSMHAHAEVKAKSRVAKAFQKLESEADKLANSPSEDANGESSKDASTENKKKSPWKRATFGNGCFWCTEAVFEELHGVRRVVSGYSGGRIKNPTYRQVCTGLTGHAEVIHLEYNPELISYAKLLEVFWRTHDPTTLNKQGADEGPQYRSAVFYHDEEQKALASHYKKKLNEGRAYGRPVVTEITKFKNFYPAEKYHQDYFEINGRAPYCRAVIKPKMTKFRRIFADELARNPKNKKSSK